MINYKEKLKEIYRVLHRKPPISGIYFIYNKINGKAYIGSSKQIHKRIREHFGELQRNVHDNPYLQKAYNKYGMESFEFGVLEETSIEDRLKIEQEYLDMIQRNPERYYNISDNVGYITNQRGSKNSSYNPKEYIFFHEDGRSYTGSAYDWYSRHGIKQNKASLITTGKQTHHKGWRIRKEESS